MNLMAERFKTLSVVGKCSGPVRLKRAVLLCLTACLAVTLAIAQNRGRQPNEQTVETRNRSAGGYRRRSRRPRRIPSRSEFPTWEIQPAFKDDVFTFVRIQYDADGPFGWWDRWDNDYPDGDQILVLRR